MLGEFADVIQAHLTGHTDDDMLSFIVRNQTSTGNYSLITLMGGSPPHIDLSINPIVTMLNNAPSVIPINNPALRVYDFETNPHRKLRVRGTTLWCVVHNDPGSRPFSVTIDKTSTIEFVKSTITRGYPHTFQGIDVKDIMLWKVHLHNDETSIWKIVDPTTTTTATILHESDSVAKVFPNSLGDNEYISIIVQRHTTSSSDIWYHVDLLNCQAIKLRNFSGKDIDDLRFVIKTSMPDDITCSHVRLVLWVVHPNSGDDTELDGNCFRKHNSFNALVSYYQIGEFNPINVKLPSNVIKLYRSGYFANMWLCNISIYTPVSLNQHQQPPSYRSDGYTIKDLAKSGSVFGPHIRETVDPLLRMELEDCLVHNVPGVIDALFPPSKDMDAIFKKCKWTKVYTNARWSVLDSGVYAKCKPDVVSLLKGRRQWLVANWADVQHVFEVKSNENANNNDTYYQLASYIQEVFGAQDTRNAMVGVTICGHRMHVWIFDRSGAIGSEVVDIDVQPLLFIRIIVGLADNKFGFNNTIQTTRNGRVVVIRLDTFTLLKCIYRNAGINTRAMTSTREPEWCLLKYATKRLHTIQKQAKVAMYYNHQDLNTTKDVQMGLQPTDRELAYRIHTQLVMSTVGKRITDFANHHELLTILRDALGGLQQLTGIGICHHDVSINNIVIGPTGHGVIIDLDYAVFIKDLRSNTKHHHRTGTGPFMAIHVLLGDEVHTHSHDIESLFYVFIWICCYHGRTATSHDRPNLDE
ncbi:hypothetical protein BC938DRAFT_471100 [Jimgerdemannia flammicorona]|uniref:Protein kinase domain-containing protein n=1 Tax=Jimgerdemannia flammicorona TaxID=994334 RepID=A0A433QUT7_9FUNG|nr:hypothetical protein BC938DRAFT_471100 [Jimgerdemannia flammicorona]